MVSKMTKIKTAAMLLMEKVQSILIIKIIKTAVALIITNIDTGHRTQDVN